KYRLDNRFAFDDSRENQTRRQVAAVSKKDGSENAGKNRRVKLRQKELKKDFQEAADTGFTIGNFLRYLLIAAIVIAILVFLGGQTLQIGKSMD
ncbi:MAG: hypothetical protein HC902_09695, partial [Calothrix sp. SM1_5_4]|nr:hypothetical protein [Calothrix sp. SM1_5_4]